MAADDSPFVNDDWRPLGGIVNRLDLLETDLADMCYRTGNVIGVMMLFPLLGNEAAS